MKEKPISKHGKIFHVPESRTTTSPGNTPPSVLGKRCRTCPSDRNTVVDLGVTEFEGQVLGGDEGNLLGRYRPRTMFSDGYLTRPFEYNTDSGPRYCRRMSD